MEAAIETMLWSAGAIVVLMVGVWLVSVIIKDASIVDIAWGAGFVVVAWTAFAVTDGTEARKWLVVGMVSLWGLRLAGYLAWRNLGKGEDYRYQAMRKFWGPKFPIVSLFTVFLLQGLLMFVVSLPAQMAQIEGGPDSLTWLDFLGIALFAVGFFFESVGDWQLAQFKADPANKGQVMDKGLWRYTRHPNYFGDFCVWWGIFLVALSRPELVWTIVGPITMSVLLLRVSGVALLERSIKKRRPGYEEYVRRTSSFFPRPPKKA